MEDEGYTPDKLETLRQLWVSMQCDMLEQAAQAKQLLESMCLHCTPTRRLQLTNGPLQYNYME